MADLDITQLILSEHDAFRRSFTEIEALTDAAELGRRWDELADQLEVHAAGEEEVFYPHLLQEVDDSEGDTEHAVKDHNEIRDAVRSVADHEVGTDPWWAALRGAREATVDHLGEEEQDVLPPFKEQAPEDLRTDLGMRWLAFRDAHDGARGLSGDDKDPEAYVEEHANGS
ncbi:MAG: uncharacterized protein JWN08_390 [Frankiales bacterium]|jgi:hypothetical protein|nr:uncharacterized protein [Frankiales bacterium]